MEAYSQIRKITDENKRNGILLNKETIYRTAWFHKGIPRWNINIYGKEGQNFEEWIYNDKNIKFIIISIPGSGNYQLEMEDFKKFYVENLNVKDTIFHRIRFLFPLKLCKKLEKK